MNNKKMIGNICFLSFLKRFFILFLCIILCFNVVCKPKKTYGATLGVAVTWGLSEYLAALLASAGIALTVDSFCRGLGLYGGDDEVTEDEALQWCKNNISIDGDNNVVFTDDAKAFVNDYLLGTYKDSVTMIYRYPIQPQNVGAETFPNKTVYDIFQKILLNYHDCYCFVIGNNSSQVSNISCRGWPVTDLNGSEFKLAYDSSNDGAIRINIIPAPFAGVSQYMDLYSAATTFYTDDWTSTFYPKSFWILPDGRVYTFSNKQILGYGSSYLQVDSDNLPELDTLDTQYYWSWYGTSYATFLDDKHGSSFSAGACYSASPNALNVYKSEADMKKDIGSQVIGNFIPDYYTGTPNYNITTSEVNNIVNNYYPSEPDDNPGGGSGSDDDGGGSSGGVFDDIISGIASGVGSIIKGIFSIIKELVDAIADAIGSIVGSITDLMSLLNGNFTEFLSAVFPFMPSEFVTILVGSLTLCMLGIIIKIFKG